MRKTLHVAFIALWGLLCLGLLALWLRSQGHQDQFVYARAGGRLWQLFCHSGDFGFSTATPWPNAERRQFFSIDDSGTFPLSLCGPVWWAGGASMPQSDWEALGLHILSGYGKVPLRPDGTASWAKSFPEEISLVRPGNPPPATAPVRFLDVYIPFWLPAVLLAAFPVGVVLNRARLARRLRRARQNPGLCPGCGYDLRATPHAGGALFDRCPECGRETGRKTAPTVRP